MSKRNKVIISGLTIACIILGCYSGVLFKSTNNDIQFTVVTQEDTLTTHFLDIGQGDCIFIELPNEETLLIDSGDKGNADFILQYIQDLGYDKINYAIATHPHADHIGSFTPILQGIKIDKFFLPNKIHSTKLFSTMYDTLNEQNIDYVFVSTGDYLLNEKDLTIKVLSPDNIKYSNLNDYSIVIKLDYGESEFLFTGDAEHPIEKKLIENNIDIDSDILKVSHHGADSANSKNFIQTVSPEISIISCGTPNKYGHPHVQTLDILTEQNTEIYRTDELGTIIITTDNQENFVVVTEEGKKK